MSTPPILLRRRAVTSLTVGLACLLGTAAAQAQTAAPAPTVITQLPFTITTSGTYVLNNNLNSTQTDGALITVNASNVTIDFQNRYIAGPVGNTAATTTGVFAQEQSNVTVRNGTVAFCQFGVAIQNNNARGTTTNSVNPLVDNMRVTNCYQAGINVSGSPASRITNCQVSQIGGASGLFITIAGIASSSPGGVVQGNVVSGVNGPNGPFGPTAFGILAGGSSDFVRLNAVFNASTGINGGKQQNNLTAGCATPFTNGANAGGNN